jgi:RNA polymerase sigma factor (sigma-70 family)
MKEKRYRPKKGRTVSWNYLMAQNWRVGKDDDWSAYWNWAGHRREENGEIFETSRANPDLSDEVTENRVEREEIAEAKIQVIMENSGDILSRQEHKVMHLLMAGYSLIKIAETLNISQPSVSIYVKRGRKKLKKLLQNEGL